MRGQNKLIDFFLRSLSKVDLLLITYLIFLLFLSNIKSIYNSIPSIFSVFINFDYLRNIDSAFGFVVGAILLISVPPMYLLSLRALLSNDDINTLEILSPMYHLILIVLSTIVLFQDYFSKTVLMEGVLKNMGVYLSLANSILFLLILIYLSNHNTENYKKYIEKYYFERNWKLLSLLGMIILTVLYFILLDALGTIKSAVTAYFITILVVEIIRSVLSKVPFTKS